MFFLFPSSVAHRTWLKIHAFSSSVMPRMMGISSHPAAFTSNLACAFVDWVHINRKNILRKFEC